MDKVSARNEVMNTRKSVDEFYNPAKKYLMKNKDEAFIAEVVFVLVDEQCKPMNDSWYW